MPFDLPPGFARDQLFAVPALATDGGAPKASATGGPQDEAAKKKPVAVKKPAAKR
ncbi:hypothetical protein [Streptomyces sp. NPDC047097]|uniref:hypothetical protein n=1 Tax=Streptomyces sp. NPDC047097 TaxID=3155260 RepID=UPI0033DE27CA